MMKQDKTGGNMRRSKNKGGADWKGHSIDILSDSIDLETQK